MGTLSVHLDKTVANPGIAFGITGPLLQCSTQRESKIGAQVLAK